MINKYYRVCELSLELEQVPMSIIYTYLIDFKSSKGALICGLIGRFAMNYSHHMDCFVCFVRALLKMMPFRELIQQILTFAIMKRPHVCEFSFLLQTACILLCISGGILTSLFKPII